MCVCEGERLFQCLRPKMLLTRPPEHIGRILLLVLTGDAIDHVIIYLIQASSKKKK